MAVPVNVYVFDETVTKVPLAGVTVAVFNPSTMAQVAAGVTDVDGMAALLLTGGTYEARFFKQGFIFSNPLSMLVLEPATQPNGFEVGAHAVGVFGVPIDPALCRCVGRFVNLKNQPMPNAMVRISAEMEIYSKSPKVAYGNMVGSSAMEFRTDSNGFVVIDLLRTGKFWLTFAGEEDISWNFVVPDRASVNLIDLIHPQLMSMAYEAVGNAVSLAVGGVVEVPITVEFSDYQDHSDSLNNLVTITNNDPAIADITLSGPKLVITGVSVGSTTVTAEAIAGLFPTRLPNSSFEMPTLSVTVL